MADGFLKSSKVTPEPVFFGAAIVNCTKSVVKQAVENISIAFLYVDIMSLYACQGFVGVALFNKSVL